eukprot:TRINITY_DN63767_c0_g1_i1.p1 TRINITY_DN63767_c0_g1~~TRINITY_DN63767_c0_g1_i1.p1  ORF type:complete len:221 (+),score=29.40 TRINITY_DN63767_c0_g1_i1:127-789(+)
MSPWVVGLVLLLGLLVGSVFSAVSCNLFTLVPGVDSARYFTNTYEQDFDAGNSYCNQSVRVNSTLPITPSNDSLWTLCQFTNLAPVLVGLKQLPGSSEPAGGWYWADGTPESQLPAPWNPGSPDNNVPESCAGTTCGQQYGYWLLDDYSCTSSIVATWLVCETKLSYCGTECPKGAFYNTTSHVCQKCPKGTYSDASGSVTACQSCTVVGAKAADNEDII